MFDNVGKGRQEGAGRTISSFLLTLLFNGSLFSLVVWLGSQVVEKAEEVKEKLVAVDMAPPPPPPPPPPAGGGKKKKEKKPDEEVVPQEEIPVEPVILEEEEEKPVEDEGEEEGPEGVEGGEKDGVVDGTVGGVKDGVLGGQLGGTGVKTVHWSEIQVKTRVKPRFPEAAKQLGMKEEKCIVHIVVGTDGMASDVSFKACPELFKASAKEAAMQWQWYPLQEGGQSIKAQFDINFVFKLND